MIPVLLVSLAALALIGAPLAFAMGISATLGIAVHDFLPFEIVAQRTLNALDKFPFLAVPMFILAGELMNTSGITARIIRFCMALVGHMRGWTGPRERPCQYVFRREYPGPQPLMPPDSARFSSRR